MIIRTAVAEDLGEINDIYNYYVRASTCTYQEEESTMAERKEWWKEHGEGHPVVVAEASGKVVGWASLSKFHGRCAYRFTAESSVYVRQGWQRRGVGKALMEEAIKRGRDMGLRTVIAVISADQKASITLHERLGFVVTGKLKEVGFKFGRWLDVAYMQLMT